MDSGCITGGIVRLRELISEHEPFIAFDFRSNFGLSIDDIGCAVSYREAIQLVSVLEQMPSAWLHAKIAGWDYPVSMEWIALADTLDVVFAVNSGKGKRPTYPRPWTNKDSNRIGNTNTVSQSRIREVLDAMRPEEQNG